MTAESAPGNGPDSFTAATAYECSYCGQEDDNCRCDEDDDFECSICNGSGEFFGNELPGYDAGWHVPDQLYPCPSCNGSGNRRDQRYM